MATKIYCLLFLVITITTDVFSRVAADKVESWDRSVRSRSRVSERKCQEYTRGSTCKSSYDNIDSNAVEDAQLGEFPHLAFIATNSSRQKGSSVFVCTGSLISPRFVLTAAQCTRNPDLPLSYVSLGDHNVNPTVDDGITALQVPIRTIHTHPEYKSPRRYNDIALLELVSDVPFNANVRPACLWMEPQLSGHEKALVATIDRTPTPELRQNVIQKVAVTIKDDAVCNISSWINRLLPHGMDVTQLCGKEATGSNPECKAMGGAPLQIVLNQQNSCEFHVIGLTSFGFRTCDEYPTIFTRVSSFVDWIESTVWPTEAFKIYFKN